VYQNNMLTRIEHFIKNKKIKTKHNQSCVTIDLRGQLI